MKKPDELKSDEELWHELVAAQSALRLRAAKRARERGEPVVDEVGISGPGGFSGRVRGLNAIVLVALIAALVYSIYVSRVESSAAREEHAGILNELQNVAYILTLSEGERKALNLAPPESLARRMRNNLRPAP